MDKTKWSGVENVKFTLPTYSQHRMAMFEKKKMEQLNDFVITNLQRVGDM